MGKLVDATKVFACPHEYVALPDHFICIHCEHVRTELPFAKDNRKGLLFFPTSVRAMTETAKAG